MNVAASDPRFASWRGKLRVYRGEEDVTDRCASVETADGSGVLYKLRDGRKYLDGDEAASEVVSGLRIVPAPEVAEAFWRFVMAGEAGA